MSILSGLLATTLVLFLLLCRSMTPKETSTSSSSSGESQDDDMKLEEKAEDQQSLLKNMVTEDDPATIELNEWPCYHGDKKNDNVTINQQCTHVALLMTVFFHFFCSIIIKYSSYPGVCVSILYVMSPNNKSNLIGGTTNHFDQWQVKRSRDHACCIA